MFDTILALFVGIVVGVVFCQPFVISAQAKEARMRARLRKTREMLSKKGIANPFDPGE